jgi:hypothetical protein
LYYHFLPDAIHARERAKIAATIGMWEMRTQWYNFKKNYGKNQRLTFGHMEKI